MKKNTIVIAKETIANASNNRHNVKIIILVVVVITIVNFCCLVFITKSPYTSLLLFHGNNHFGSNDDYHHHLSHEDSPLSKGHYLKGGSKISKPIEQQSADHEEMNGLLIPGVQSTTDNQPYDQNHRIDRFEYIHDLGLWTIKKWVKREEENHQRQPPSQTRKALGGIQAENETHIQYLQSLPHRNSHAGLNLTIWPQVPSMSSDDHNQRNYHRTSELSTSYDRIIEQLIYEPAWIYNQYSPNDEYKILKIKPDRFDLEPNGDIFLLEGCLVNRCEMTYDWNEADAIIFKNLEVEFVPEEYNRTKQQIWIAYTLESPSNIYKERFPRYTRTTHQFNWTATYRHDSDIVTPYEKFVPFAQTIEQYHSSNNLSYNEKRNFYYETSDDIKRLISQKSKNIVWFVSNCYTSNSREKYVEALARYIDIDIFGRCGNQTCDKSNHKKCLEMANSKYRFYIAFENSKHTDYITEKFFNNGLGKNDINHMMIPIVMGTSKADYLELAPKDSFIHVDDFKDPRMLAEFLKTIADDHVLFNSYFIWKSLGKFIDTKFYCRVCTMLHHSRKNNIHKYYNDAYQWFVTQSYNEIYWSKSIQ